MMAASVLLIGACQQASIASVLSGRLNISAPSSVQAGERIEITVGPVNEARNGTPIGLVTVGAYGPRVYKAAFESGLAHFSIPPEDTMQPGYLALIVAAGEARGEASIVLFKPGSSSVSNEARPIQSLAGVSTPNEQDNTQHSSGS